MDKNILSDIWEQSCNLLRQEMTEISYDTWIKVLVPLSGNDEVLYFRCDSMWTQTILNTRYKSLVLNAIMRVSSRFSDIEFLVDEEINDILGSPSQDEVPETPSLRLNPKYTFSTFVVGNSNRFAHAASLAVAESPANAYNPLFIYGGVGLGKTHLMHAVGHYVNMQNPSAKVMYTTSENFTNELIKAIKNNKNIDFRNRYRSVDVLLIDDIQFIAGKDSTQDEFFHTFNALHESGKQIILSSDKQPKDIPTLEERLRSRFEWGLIADISRPDLETRVAILRKKAEIDNLVVPDGVHLFIAEKIESNIRELEGCLTRVVAYSQLINVPISLATAQEALKDMLSLKDPKRITTPLIISAVAQYYTLTPDDLKGKRRNRELSVPRHIAMYLTREMTDLSLPKIGEEFGGRDHTTVIHACDKVRKDIKASNQVSNIVEDLKKIIVEL